MNKKFLYALAGIATLSFAAFAQNSNEGVQSFQKGDNAWQRDNGSAQVKMLPQFEKLSGKMAMNNIVNAEQVFCYEVFPNAKNFNGYTLDGFPIRGFCGVLDKKTRDVITPFFFANQSAVDFDKSEKCSMQPKIIMRFVRGVDFTDVLFSSPCASLAIFYAGKLRVYNYTPIAKEMDEIIKQMEKLHETFVSPALLNQLLPKGIIQNDQQRSLVNKASEPVRNWEKKATDKMKKQEEEIQKQNTGWNKLKNKAN